ncbi:MAG: hypothetical protein K0A93_09350 [Desulfuromonadaceae bacterium]|nr:hypothetical protein [Desulfuromonadaceae bacterium]
MKRFSFTLLAICLVLLYLGGTDLALFLRNRQPQQVTIQQLENSGAPREWLTIDGGYMNLLEAINMTGTIQIDSLLVPLTVIPGGKSFKVLFETRDPQILELWTTYHFKLDSTLEKDRFLAENLRAFQAPKRLTGLIAGNLVATNNQNKLLKLARDVGMDVATDAIFVSEGKNPGLWRGLFFVVVGLLGALKVLLSRRSSRPQADRATLTD